jgi:phage terminase Nu1 subunit (DNA packaging protein)
LSVITDEDDVRDETLKKERLEVRRKGLENRRADANVVAMAMLEFELEEIAARIAKADESIAALNNRKAEIEAA